MKITMKDSKRTAFTGFRYFWGKYVSGFDVTQHCARCLKGPYIKPIGVRMPVNEEVVVPSVEGQIIYICGVSQPFSMKNNFHFAVVHDDFGFIEKETYNGITVCIEGAKELSFEADQAEALGVPARFSSCRNFQFGVQYFMNP